MTEPGRARSAASVRYLNRELSWLDFNARVLALADDPTVPLLERAKFLAIFSQNLDEFFQVRVAGLKDQVAAGLDARSRPTAARPAQQLLEIRDRVEELLARAGADLPRRGRARRWPAAASCFSRVGRARRGRRASTSTRTFEERIFPVLTPAGRRPRPPVPVHLQPVAEPGGDRPRPGHRRAPLRPGEGAAAAAPLRGDARRRALRAPRAGHRRPPRPAVPGHGGRGATSPSGSPATPTSPSRRRRPTTCSPRSRSSCAAGGSAGPCASRSTPTITDEVRDAAPARARPRRRRRLRARRPARPRRALGAARPRPARPEGPAVGRRVTPARLDGERRRAARHLRRACARATCSCTTPTTRSRTSVEEFIRQAAVDPQGAGHQADAVPHVGRQPDRQVAHPGRRAGQAGGGAGRAQGPLRRAGQHRVGPRAGGGGRPRRLRPGRAQDPHQDRARRARRARRHPPLLPHRHRQLQLEDGPPLRGPRPAHRRPRHRRRPHPALQLPHRLRPRRPLPQAARRARTRCGRGIERADPQRDGGAGRARAASS